MALRTPKLVNGSLRMDSMFYMFGNVFTKGFLLISMPFLARMLNPSDFGILTVFETLFGILSVVISFGVSDSIVRYYYEQKMDFNKAAGSMYMVAVGIAVSLVTIIYLSKKVIATGMNIPEIVVVFAVIFAFMEIPKSIFLQMLIAEKKSKAYSLYTTTASFLSLSFTLVFVYYIKDHRYVGRFYGQLVPSLSFFIISQVAIIKGFNFMASRKDIIKYANYFFNYSLPLLPYRLSGIILTYIDSVIIASTVGLKETGLYSIAYRVGMGILILHVSIGQAIEPRIMILLKDLEPNTITINKLIEQAAKYIFFFGYIVAVFAKDILNLLIPASYNDAVDLVPVIVLSYCVLFIFEQFTRINRHFKKTQVNAFAMFVSVVANVILNLILIPVYGYGIAATTTLLSFMIMLAVLLYHTRYVLKIEQIVDLRSIISKIFLPVVLAYTSCELIDFENGYSNLLIQSLLSTALLGYIFYSDVVKLLKKYEWLS